MDSPPSYLRKSQFLPIQSPVSMKAVPLLNRESNGPISKLVFNQFQEIFDFLDEKNLYCQISRVCKTFRSIVQNGNRFLTVLRLKSQITKIREDHIRMNTPLNVQKLILCADPKSEAFNKVSELIDFIPRKSVQTIKIKKEKQLLQINDDFCYLFIAVLIGYFNNVTSLSINYSNQLFCDALCEASYKEPLIQVNEQKEKYNNLAKSIIQHPSLESISLTLNTELLKYNKTLLSIHKLKSVTINGFHDSSVFWDDLCMELKKATQLQSLKVEISITASQNFAGIIEDNLNLKELGIITRSGNFVQRIVSLFGNVKRSYIETLKFETKEKDDYDFVSSYEFSMVYNALQQMLIESSALKSLYLNFRMSKVEENEEIANLLVKYCSISNLEMICGINIKFAIMRSVLYCNIEKICCNFLMVVLISKLLIEGKITKLIDDNSQLSYDFTDFETQFEKLGKKPIQF
jgi:hypothetical protein